MKWIFFKEATLVNLRKIRDQEWILRIIDFSHRYHRLNWDIVGWLVQYNTQYDKGKVKNVYAIAGCIGTPILGVIDIISWRGVRDIPIVIPESLNKFMNYGYGDVVYVRAKSWSCCLDDLAVFELIIEPDRRIEVMQCVRKFHKEYPTRRRHVPGYIYAHLDVPRVIAITMDLSETVPKVRLVDVLDWCQKRSS
jgi:hypothetical protein